MALSLRPEHLGRYKDIARLLVKYGRRDLLETTGLDAAWEDEEKLDEQTAADASELADDLERLGPTYVKLGQLLSTRADLLPPAYLEALSRLQDRVEPFSGEEAVKIVEDELGVPIGRAFAEFEVDPLASASLGQVHRARLHDGRPVAVKVQRPAIRKRIRDDLDALHEIATFLDGHTDVGDRYQFAGMVEEFRRSMLRELDYEREAANLTRLRGNLESYAHLVVPAPIDSHSTTKVLAMEFVDGVKITTVGPLARIEYDGPRLAHEVFDAYIKQILEDGFFHADPHPGNVFLTDDGRLALLDLGMIGTVSPDMQDRIVKLLLAVSEGRGEDAARTATDLGERMDGFQHEHFVRRVSAVVTEYHGAAMNKIAAGEIVAEMTRVAGESGLRPAPELTMIGKALLNLDEVVRLLDPEFDPNAELRQRAASMLQERLQRGISPGNLFSAALEAKEFAERLPGRVNRVMDTLADGEIRLDVRGFDEKEFMRGVQKVANRITTGLVIAALIVGAAMLTQVETTVELFGYPALAIVFFVIAALGGVALLGSIVIKDRRDR